MDDFIFEHTGTVQEFVVPKDGIYKFELYGAGGGNVEETGNHHSNYIKGSPGGRTVGYKELEKGTTLYVCVGGQGRSTKDGINLGGSHYNCGTYYIGHRTGHSWSGGGGATHIATTNRGTLDKYADYRDEILLVAGGAGGSSSYCSDSSKGVVKTNTGIYGKKGNSGEPVYRYGQLLDERHDGRVGWGVKLEFTKEPFNLDRFGQGSYNSGGGYHPGKAYDATQRIEPCGGQGFIGGMPEFTYNGIIYTPSINTDGIRGNGKAVISFVSESKVLHFNIDGFENLNEVYYNNQKVNAIMYDGVLVYGS